MKEQLWDISVSKLPLLLLWQEAIFNILNNKSYIYHWKKIPVLQCTKHPIHLTLLLILFVYVCVQGRKAMEISYYILACFLSHGKGPLLLNAVHSLVTPRFKQEVEAW